MKMKVSLDGAGFSRKPNGYEIGTITKRIAQISKELELEELANLIGTKGYTFCPAVFSEGQRKKDCFLQMQLFGLDFDTGIEFDKVEEIAKKYRLSIAFAYYTFSSTKEKPRFRVIFVNDVPVTDRYAAEIMLKMLLVIFPDADKSCKDVSRMFFGGKGLLRKVKEETINIVQLKDAFQKCIYKKGIKNYSRNIQQFAKENNIMCINDVLQIECVHMNSKFEEKTDFHPYIYTSDSVFSSNGLKYIIYFGYQKNVRKERQNSIAVKVSKTDMEQKCQLYHDFKVSPHIPHNDRFLLLTNMLQIKGGAKLFLSIIREKDYDEKDWRFYAKYAKDNQYKPQSCDGNCPYDKECSHEKNMLLTVKEKEQIVKLNEEQNYESLKEVYQHVCTCLEHAVESSENEIVIIPAQTAIGKTEAYCNLIRDHPEKKFIVAVPTNQLKHEVYQRLQKKGVDAQKTLSLDDGNLSAELENKIQRYYQWGLEKEVMNLLKNYIKENKEKKAGGIAAEIYFCEAYVNQIETLIESRVIVTTHVRMALFSKEMINDYCIIVDEDILSTFFKDICCVSMETVHKVFTFSGCPRHLKDKLYLVTIMKEGEFRKLDRDILADGLSEEELRELDVFDNVNSLAYATVCYKKNDDLYYFNPPSLPERKMIVLSATVDAELYRKYFRGRKIIEYPYKKAKYQGTLTQMTAYSMSRQCIQNNKEKLKAYLKPLQKEYQLITFMKYEEEFHALGLHFGNVEGVDQLSGKDIMVVGTPHLDKMVYQLIGYHLGMEVEQEALAVRRINYNGYQFNLMTYKGEELRNLQLYFIHKELEQCIGRARLLRNDCKVLVLSNFPCEQAELIQEDYLNEKK